MAERWPALLVLIPHVYRITLSEKSLLVVKKEMEQEHKLAVLSLTELLLFRPIPVNGLGRSTQFRISPSAYNLFSISLFHPFFF